LKGQKVEKSVLFLFQASFINRQKKMLGRVDINLRRVFQDRRVQVTTVVMMETKEPK
jgi:hypothetical protein